MQSILHMNIKKYKKCTTLNLIRLVHKIAKIKFFTLMDWYPIMAMGLVAVIKILLLVFVVRSQRARNAHEDENSNIWTRQSPPNSTPISQNISIIAAPSYSEVVDNSHDFPSVLYINECTKNIDTDDPPPTYQEFLTMNNTRKQENNL